VFSSFDWEFEEDEHLPRQTDQDTPPPLWRRPWPRRVAAVVVLLALISLSGRACLNARRKAISEAEAQLRAAVQLELKTIVDGDAELFRSRQDPGDPTWREQQVNRYFAAPFVPVPGLEPASRPSEIQQVDLVGRTARVQLIHWFQPSVAQPISTHPEPATGQSAPLPFQVTWSYHYAADGTWYHTAPLDDEWRIPYFKSTGTRTTQRPSRESVVIGFTLTEAKRLLRVPALDDGSLVVVAAPGWFGPVLQIEATQAEAELLDPIAAQLGELVAQGCDWLDCPSDARFNLSFEDLPGPKVQRSRWTLPSLYLAGLPASEEAFAAWERALQTWMVELLARTRLADPLLTDRLIYRHLVQRLQAELGLVAPPSPDVDLLAQAVLAGQQHAPQELWAATYEPDDLAAMRLLEAEVAAFLDLLAGRVGSQRLAALLPILSASFPPGDATLFDLYELDRDEFTAAWYDYLSQLTGQAILPLSIFALVPPVEEPLRPPPSPASLAISPGDQIALVCDSRLWVGDADGRALFPLTSVGYRFSAPHWSPDGRWLVVSWFHSPSEPFSALYMLAADGSEARLLTGDRAAKVSFYSWGPDGRWVVYRVGMEYRAVDVETGETRRLPGAPAWSPDGSRLVYAAGAPRVPWLADGDWGNPRRIAGQPGLHWNEAVWSPDSSRLALTFRQGHPYQNATAIYDLATERITSFVTLADLIAGFFYFGENYVTNSTEFAHTLPKSQRWAWPLGWSADGDYLLVWGQWTAGELGTIDQTLLAAVPVAGVDGTAANQPSSSRLARPVENPLRLTPAPPQGTQRLAPYTIAYGRETFLTNISWSPSDPDRLVFRWRTGEGQSARYESFLFDLGAGRLYSTTHARRAVWSPDGAWVAFVGADAMTIVDQDGQERVTLELPESCTDLAWNPATDLSGLDERFAAALSGHGQ
jgi:Tol biopolymer transport system component